MPFNHPDYAGVRAAVKRDMHPAPAQHLDSVAVNRFAGEMAAKMEQARAKGRGGWETCPPDVLSRMLREHVEKGDPRDVANFCMMLWHLGQPIAPAPAAQAVEPEFFTVFASHNGGKIALPGYSNETEKGVKDLVLQAARQEGYKGTVSGRLLELGWWIGPVFASPYEAAAPAPAAVAVPDGWHKAVLDACMVTEACYVEADPAASVRNLIDWHASVAVEAAALAATPPAQATYSLDADTCGIRAMVADAITGALALGAQNSSPPPDSHWLAPFWKAARAERELQAQAQDVQRDAAFEAVRKKFCKLQRYSFLLDDKGNVRRVPDFCGNWVEFEAAHTLFEPASVDAAIAAQGEAR